MFKHYLITAWRNFLRYKLITIISVLGLTLGFVCFIVAIGTMSVLKSADQAVPNADRVVMVWVHFTDATTNFRRPFLWLTPEGATRAIAREFPELEGVAWFNASPNVPVVAGERRAYIDAAAVDVHFLEVLDLPRTQTVSGNPLAIPRTVVLSEAAAMRLFGTTDVLGRMLRLRDKVDVTVTAVLKSLPRPSNLGSSEASNAHYEMLYSFDTRSALIEAVTGKPATPTPIARQWGLHFGAATYALLPNDGSLTVKQFESRLKGIAERNGAPKNLVHEFRVVPLKESLLARFNYSLLRDIEGFSIGGVLITLALIVLGIACANCAHLSFAQSRARLKETGLRRSIGATRSQLALQAFVEATLHIVIALALALSMCLALGSIVGARAETDVIGLSFGNMDFWLSIAACASIVTLLIAAYPALALSRVKPVNAVQASSPRSVGAKLLMSSQFVATGVFIVVVIVALIQNETIRSKALVPDKDPLIHLGVKWQLSGANLETWRAELLKSPAIRVVSASENPPWSDAFTLIEFRTRENAPFESIAHDIGYDYDKAVGFRFLAGRPFDRTFADIEKRSATSNTAIIDLSLSRRMGYATPNAAIGQLLNHTGRDAVTIIGVIEDNPLRIQTFMDSVGNVYFPGVRGRSLPIIQIDRTRIPEGLAHIDLVWKKFVPTEPVQRYFADEVFQWSYFYYSLLGTVLTICGGIALTVSLLGASGFALFASQQRAHEIGVRKTLGASAKHIWTMLLKDFSKPILIANLFAWPLAFLAVKKYLSLYLERIDVTIFPFVVSLCVSLFVVWLAVGRQAWRAANINPASVLRNE
jgi:putative ABC transport system permease protein